MTLWEQISESLIVSGAWLSILQGLRVTLRISVCSLLLGTLLAVPVCALRMSPRRALSTCAKGFIAFVRGTPVLMLLMLFYFVVFESSRVEPSLIAILAFSVNASANIAEIMRSALGAIPKGQLDAARALGMRRPTIFLHITLPQASLVAMPVYQSAAVNLLQWTSVVGYVSIVDLTRAINFVSSRTMQPLLMLAVGIALYLGLAYLIVACCVAFGRRKFGLSRRYDG